MQLTPPPKSAPPPIHAVATLVSMSALTAGFFPSLETIDEVATIDTFTRSVLPSGTLASSPAALGCIRIAFAAAIFTLSAVRIGNPDGYQIVIPKYHPGSKLRPPASGKIPLRGIWTHATFTYWSWLILGFHFLLSGVIALAASRDAAEDLIGPLTLRLALLTYEISAPTAFLVSSVVKYALWPNALRMGGTKAAGVFATKYALMVHNANVAFVLAEACLLGGIPVEISHIAVAPVVGIAYVLFSWIMSGRWSPGDGPQFVYFFFDTTREGWYASAVQIVLLAVLMAFYGMFSFADEVLAHLGENVPVRFLVMFASSLLVCRFRN
mmetsp:Transcript_38512/g.78555  ORF Transcript_38512/g.78555 Transcript_38512/m.78555 type:complete len:325 (-) Transcript_38512:470-1444(-)